MNNGGVRKVRSDRKRDIKPTVTLELRECIYRLAYITDTPVKDVAEAICINGVTSPKVIEHIAQHFRRDIRFASTLYRSNANSTPIKKRYLNGQTARITIRFKTDTYDTIAAMAYALDCTVSRACALVLDASVRDGEFIDGFVRGYLEQALDADRMGELRRVLKYVNANNPYEETYTWAALLSLMVEEVRDASTKVTETVTDFVVKHWRD